MSQPDDDPPIAVAEPGDDSVAPPDGDPRWQRLPLRSMLLSVLGTLVAAGGFLIVRMPDLIEEELAEGTTDWTGFLLFCALIGGVAVLVIVGRFIG